MSRVEIPKLPPGNHRPAVFTILRASGASGGHAKGQFSHFPIRFFGCPRKGPLSRNNSYGSVKRCRGGFQDGRTSPEGEAPLGARSKEGILTPGWPPLNWGVIGLGRFFQTNLMEKRPETYPRRLFTSTICLWLSPAQPQSVPVCELSRQQGSPRCAVSVCS